MNDAELAALLQPCLKTSGPAPCLAYIEAAILVARDALSTRDACDAVAGVPRTVNSKIGKLAERVGRLLAMPEFAVSLPSAPPPPMSPPPPPPPPAAEPICWQHDQPPRLLEDFNGEQGRAEYEEARAQWFAWFSKGRRLPHFDPNSSGQERREQVSARAALWEKAVRAYKDQQRDRTDRNRVRPEDDSARRQLAERLASQQTWVDSIGKVASGK